MIFIYNNRKIKFSKEVLSLLNSYRQTGDGPEQGGILLGKVSDTEIEIVKASIPNSLDRSLRFRFIRNKKSAQLIVDYEFKNSGGTIIYLGEWHTHPEYHPTPSTVDIKMIATQFKKNDINEDFLLMVIIGIKSNYVSIYNGTELIHLNGVL